MVFNQFIPGAFAPNNDRPLRPMTWIFALLIIFGYATTASASRPALLPGDSTIHATICANENYPFDGQLLNTAGIYSATYVASDGSDSTVTLLLEVLPLLEGTVTADICEGEFYEFNGETYHESGTYSATLPGSNGCDSIATLELTVHPTVITNLRAGICAGTNYVFQGDTVTESGVYSVVLQTVHGCDSIVQLKLDVVSFFEIPLAVSICKGETYAFGGNLLEDAGTYVDTLQAIGGCDSIVTLTLKVLPVPSTLFTVGICEGTSYVFQGDTLSSTGLYIYPYTAANGCDSLVMLDLNVVTEFDHLAEATICQGESYVFGDNEIKDAGVYTYTYTAIGGCDSTVTLTLTVLPIQTGAVEATICEGESYEYQGIVLSDPGQYEFVLSAANGCDSVVTFTLHVLPIPNTVIEASICAGTEYDFNGEILSEEGVYEQTYTAASGCDSIVSLILTVLEAPTTSLNAVVCVGETYDFNGEILDASGTYSQQLVAANGCDSTVILHLTILPELATTLDIAICAGEHYEFDGSFIADAGTYTAVFSSINGCDSTVTLHLEVLPIQNSTLEVSICTGSSYDFNGTVLTDAGTYTALLTGINGCDSTVTLVLSVLPTHTTTLEVTLCEGEGFGYNGQLLTDAGTYSYGYQGENGCDSTVNIFITVLPVSHTPLLATICEGSAYDYNGQELTEEGDYDFTFDAVNGCDSIVTIHLSVLPQAHTTLNVTLCSGNAYQFNGQALTQAGTYTAIDPGVNGCDSTTTLNLNFVMAFDIHLEVAICAGESYDFNGLLLTAAGNYSDTLTATGGCDSLVTLALTILPVSESTTEASICAGETYLFAGENLADAGTYTAHLTSSNGCDSVAVLHLNVMPMLITTLEATTCANVAYPFHGLALSLPGTYTAVLTASNGCDSTIILHLSVLPLATSVINASVCAGEAYEFNGTALTQSGTYTAIYTAINGCDSIVTLYLEVLPKAENSFAAVVCDGIPYVYNNQVLTQSGVYTFTHPGAAVNGCDSTETLFLTIFPVIPPTQITATICAGETYMLGNNVLSFTGIYTAELPSATGCDSVVVVNLTVLPDNITTLAVTICQGDSYPFNGQLLTMAGSYSQMLTGVNGCDSTVILVLTVNVVNNLVSLQGGTLIAQAANAQYQWIDCATNQPIPGATGASFTPVVTGQYAVQVTNQEGCSAESDCQLVEVVAVTEPWSQGDWKLQPNPAGQQSLIQLDESLESDVQVELYDPSGRLLRQMTMAAGDQQLNLDLNDLPNGWLLVRLVGERGSSTKMLMKAGL